MMPQPKLFDIRAVRRLPPPLPTRKSHLRAVPSLPPIPKSRKPETVIELSEADFLEVRDIPYAPRTRVVLKEEFIADISPTGLVGIAPKDTPDWAVCSLFIREDDCLVGEREIDLPLGYSYYKTELREDGTPVLHFTHLIRKISFFIPKHLVQSVRSLSKNVTVWRNY